MRWKASLVRRLGVLLVAASAYRACALTLLTEEIPPFNFYEKKFVQ